jgi:hypothetical protein
MSARDCVKLLRWGGALAAGAGVCAAFLAYLNAENVVDLLMLVAFCG